MPYRQTLFAEGLSRNHGFGHYYIAFCSDTDLVQYLLNINFKFPHVFYICATYLISHWLHVCNIVIFRRYNF